MWKFKELGKDIIKSFKNMDYMDWICLPIFIIFVPIFFIYFLLSSFFKWDVVEDYEYVNSDNEGVIYKDEKMD